MKTVLQVRATYQGSYLNVDMLILNLIKIGKLTNEAGKQFLNLSLRCIDKTSEDFEDLINELNKITRGERIE